MRTLHATFGGKDVTVFAPRPDEFDPEHFRASCPPGQLYGLDVEGTYMSDLGQFDPAFQLRTIQFATEGYAWVLDLSCGNQAESAAALLNDPGTWFASHTPMDVLSVALRLGCDITDRNIDTRALAAMAAPDDKAGGKDLKTLASAFCGPELEEGEAALHAEFARLWQLTGGRKNAKRALIHAHGWENVSLDCEAYLLYAGMDAIAARRLVPILAGASSAPAELIQREVWLAGQANRIRLRGMKADRARLEELSAEARRETTAAREICEEISGLSPLSPKIPEWLGSHGADWAGHATTATGKPSLDKNNARAILAFDLDHDGRAVAEAVIRYKDHQDALNKTNGILAHLTPDGRVHPELNTLGAITGRMSSSGPNFQNFNASDWRLRGVFGPDPGHVLITSDFDQVELRVVAALARETKMIEVILAGGDLHQLTADEIGIPRSVAKMTNFLIVYGGGGNALSTQAQIPLDEAREIVRTFRARYPAIDAYSRHLGARTDAVRTISGRRIPVTRTKDGDPRSYANINYQVQSSARDILVTGWQRVHSIGRGDQVWFAIHDELILQVPADEVARACEEVTACMTMDFMGVPITATAVPLLDTDGVSRWMTSSRAEKIAAGAL